MNWKAVVGGIGAASYIATWIFGVPATRTGFGREYLESRLQTVGGLSTQLVAHPSDEGDKLLAEVHFKVKHAIPLLPGLILVSHEASYGWEGVSGWTLTLWYPGRTRVLFDVG